MPEPSTSWPHAPAHRLTEAGTFMITAGTYQKAHHFRGAKRLRVLQRGLLKLTADAGWQLEAWAVFSNHYHAIAHSPDSTTGGAATLSTVLGELHRKTSTWVNRLDGAVGRKVWHNFRETRLTHPTSYFARLHYVHHNAVKHRLVTVANHYPWCSAGWFEQTASPAQVKTIYRFRTDRLEVGDEYAPATEW